MKKLTEILEQSKKQTWAILMHDHPDPDSIGSAMGLQKILSHYQIKSDIIYSGEITHQSNVSMINRLDIKLKQYKDTNLSDYNNIAIVDATPFNVELPKNKKPILIIDHHQVPEKKSLSEGIIQIDTNVGSASTIIIEILKKLKLNLKNEEGEKIATALYLGLHTDTREMLYAKKRDLEALIYIKKFANIDELDKILNAEINPTTLKTLATAINNSENYGMHCVACAGILKEKDALAQAADLLLKQQSTEHTIVFGIYEGHVLISTRSSTDQVNAGEVVKKIWGKKGSAGGRKQAAGAQLELGYFVESLPENEQIEVVKKRILGDIHKVLKLGEKS